MRSRDARRGRTGVPPERPPHRSSNLNWLDEEPRQPDQDAAAAARARQAQLTKPPGALGDLETLAITLAGWQGRAPCLERVHISVFAADHGVTAEGVSAFPAAVTAQMIGNFARGGAAINVLARELNATLEVINLGTIGQAGIAGVRDAALGPGSANFVNGPAMTEAQLGGALAAGRHSVERALAGGAQLYIGGGRGCGNHPPRAPPSLARASANAGRIPGPGPGL